MYFLLEKKDDLAGVTSLDGHQGGLRVFLEKLALDEKYVRPSMFCLHGPVLNCTPRSSGESSNLVPETLSPTPTPPPTTLSEPRHRATTPSVSPPPASEHGAAVSRSSPEVSFASPISEVSGSPPPHQLVEDRRSGPVEVPAGSPEQPEVEFKVEDSMDVDDVELETVEEDRAATPLSSLDSVQVQKEEPQEPQIVEVPPSPSREPLASRSPSPKELHFQQYVDHSPVPQLEDHHSASPSRSPTPPPPTPFPEIREPSEHEPSPLPPALSPDNVQDFSESMQGIEEAPPVVRAPNRPLPHDTSEDNVLDLLRSSEPPLPIVRSESALSASHYVLSTPPPPSSSLFAPAFTFVDDGVIHHQGTSSQSSFDGQHSKLSYPAARAHAVQSQYTLPPLEVLPAEFQRKAKSSRQKKREKEKEKEKGEGKGHQEWAPMGINKWGAVLRANPVHKRVSKATKCLSTHDWNVSLLEPFVSLEGCFDI